MHAHNSLCLWLISLLCGGKCCVGSWHRLHSHTHTLAQDPRIDELTQNIMKITTKSAGIYIFISIGLYAIIPSFRIVKSHNYLKSHIEMHAFQVPISLQFAIPKYSERWYSNTHTHTHHMPYTVPYTEPHEIYISVKWLMQLGCRFKVRVKPSKIFYVANILAKCDFLHALALDTCCHNIYTHIAHII